MADILKGLNGGSTTNTFYAVRVKDLDNLPDRIRHYRGMFLEEEFGKDLDDDRVSYVGIGHHTHTWMTTDFRHATRVKEGLGSSHDSAAPALDYTILGWDEYLEVVKLQVSVKVM
jgi:hypothetical protein